MSRGGGCALLVGGFLLVIIGIYFAAGLSQSHAVCNSALGVFASQNDCTAANALYYGGIVATIVGVVMIVAAFLGRQRSIVKPEESDSGLVRDAGSSWLGRLLGWIEVGGWD